MTQKEKDIFDRLMELPVLRIFQPLYVRYKSVLLYLFFGVLATAVDLIVFFACGSVFSVNELIANVIAWCIAVIFAYFTNRVWVFQARTQNVKETFRQFFSFVGGRVFSLGVEEAILAVFVTWLGFSEFWVKLAAQVVVVILNYIISKLIVFRKKKAE